MKLMQIELDNIFTYGEGVKVDLSMTDADRNIVLISGRNGMGKTSFLTAMKLLFSGTAESRFRQVGFPARKLPLHQYVLGDGAAWDGVINTKAVRRARAAGTTVRARVAATWEDDGRCFKAERTWSSPDQTTIREHLVLMDAEVRLTEAAAAERLEEILPKDYIGYYFFDGEDVKSLAESMDRKAADFDALLRLSFIGALSKGIGDVAKERERRGLDAPVLEQIATLEGTIARTGRLLQGARDQLVEVDEDLTTKGLELRHLQTRRENLRAGASASAREELETRETTLIAALEQKQARLANELPATVPVLANIGLVEQTLAILNAQLGPAGAPEAILARKIADRLPKWLAEIGDVVAPVQRDRICTALVEKIQSLIEHPSEVGIFSNLTLVRAEHLRLMLMRLLETAVDRQDLQSSHLRDISSTKAELDYVQDALVRIEVGSQANLEEFKIVVGQIATLEDEVALANQKKGQLQVQIEEAQKTIQVSESNLKRLEADQEEISRNSDQVRFIRRVNKALNDLHQKLRLEMRLSVEDKINQRLTQLIVDHGLIDKVTLDDNYIMTFRDGGGAVVGRSSLSSGLKQLAATALLWAMKDVAGHDLPVIIDTPLGRIDRSNQRSLLENYYPEIAKQVIILPTDSELDETKLNILSDHIAAQYVIRNDDGASASIVRGALIGGAQ